ncbi:hypothetical protein Tco_0216649, partial [Tanacetum coccineum]
DIFKSVSTDVHSGTTGESFVAGTGYSLKDKNKAKPDKTKSRIEKNAKN